MTIPASVLKDAKAATKVLRAASRHLSVLRNVAWEPSVRDDFLSRGAQGLPNVSYAHVDVTEARELISTARQLTQADHPVTAWLSRIAGTLESTAAMLQTRGTAEFYTHSTALYGTPKDLLLDGQTSVLEIAEHMDATLGGLDKSYLVRDGADEALTAQQFASALEPKLAHHFGEDAPQVLLSETLSAKATAGSRYIKVRADAAFTQMDVRQLLQHEALVHAATALNGRGQKKFPILGSAHPGTTQIQEGLAVFAEIISGTMDPVRFRRLADRVIGIQLCVEGADFIDVYKFYLERTDDPEQSFENTRRIFRGGVISGGAPFTKDMVYLNGLLRVHNFLRTVVKLNRADLIRLLFVGKLDLEDVPALGLLADAGEINSPKYLPHWAADLRFVVSYLAYSSFLNQIKMPGFQGYYEDMLKGVPSLWDAVA